MMPTQDQLCTMCDKVKDILSARLAALQSHQQALEKIKVDIIALQGVLAALQIATGQNYDPTTIPVDLDL